MVFNLQCEMARLRFCMIDDVCKCFERNTIRGNFNGGWQCWHRIGDVKGDLQSVGACIGGDVLPDSRDQSKFIQYGRAQRVDQSSNLGDRTFNLSFEFLKQFNACLWILFYHVNSNIDTLSEAG